MLCLPKLQEMKSRPLKVEMKLNDWQPTVGGGSWERGRAHNLIALHLSLEVPPVELEVTGKVQEIFCLRQFLGSWWDEMLLYLLLRPPLSADLEIMTPSTTSPLCSSPPPLLLCSLVSLFVRQQRRIVHHYKQLLRSRSGPYRGIPLQLWRFWTLLSIRVLFISARFGYCLNCACRLLVVWTSLLHWRWILESYVEKEIFLTILYKDSNVVSVWAGLEGIYGVMVLGVLYS